MPPRAGFTSGVSGAPLQRPRQAALVAAPHPSGTRAMRARWQPGSGRAGRDAAWGACDGACDAGDAARIADSSIAIDRSISSHASTGRNASISARFSSQCPSRGLWLSASRWWLRFLPRCSLAATPGARSARRLPAPARAMLRPPPPTFTSWARTIPAARAPQSSGRPVPASARCVRLSLSLLSLSLSRSFSYDLPSCAAAERSGGEGRAGARQWVVPLCKGQRRARAVRRGLRALGTGCSPSPPVPACARQPRRA